MRWKKSALENCAGIPCVPRCGDLTIRDVDGNAYNTVQIGTQCWTTTNLKVTKYNDGITSIPLNNTYTSGTVSTVWQGLTTGAYTIYGNEASSGTNATNYGFLYNYYAAAGIITAGGTSTKNICPMGYHVPTDSDWTVITNFLGGASVAGGKMKQTGTTLWNTPNTGADNTSGFTGLPGGFRDSDGSFIFITNIAFFWSATEFDTSTAWYLSLYSFGGLVIRNNFYNKSVGASIRCLRD